MVRGLVFVFFMVVCGGCAAALDPVGYYDSTPRYGTYYGRDVYGRPYYERMRGDDHRRHHKKKKRHHHSSVRGGTSYGGGRIPGPPNMQRVIPPPSGSRYGGGGYSGGGSMTPAGREFRGRRVRPRQRQR
ncbi:MAG: hypothetical protein HYT37_03120 [Candidatus Sungbacteria bacterium]|nr:hypothetical protein [Candidatus Sungbacteria bacterium]